MNSKSMMLCAAAALSAGLAMARPFRPPAVPLVQNDPFFSVWSEADRLTDCKTTHWSRKPQPISVMLTADGRTFRLCGAEPKGVPALRQTATDVRPTQTVCTFVDGDLRVELRFSTYKLTDDLDRFTRPVTYVTLRVKGTKAWSADLAISHLLATEDEKAAMTTNRCEVVGLPAFSVGRREQKPLGESGDRVRCNWGYAWTVGPKVTGDEAHWLLAYDDISCLRFLGKERPAWWRRHGQPFEEMLVAAERDYAETIAALDRFDASFAEDMRQVGGVKYATLAALAWRQSFAACNVVAGDRGEPLMFSKENASNGCMGTVDLIYPQLPHLLLSGATLVRASLEPIMQYSQTDDWPYDYAPHDVGQYPLGDGQRYGMKRRDGKDHPDADRMPVEESGNMLIAFAALTKLEGDATYAERWWPTLKKWAEYLERVGFDPQEQLCTDDFAGHLAHNANLSAKTIVALAAFGQMAGVRGEQETSAHYLALAKRLAREWTKLAGKGRERATPIVIRFDYGGKSHGMPLSDTWSQKYNLVWDRVLGLGLFPDSVGRDECAAYRRLLQPFGLPLDSRLSYTKSDWTIWSATLSGRRDDFEAIVGALYRAYDETPDRVPMTDWYWADNGKWRNFIARSVVGGYFLPVLYDRVLWEKWSKGAGLRSQPGQKCSWKRGHFQIHTIYTGRGESQFLIFPDGTTLLLDCGDGNPHTFLTKKFGDKSVPILPDEARSGGETIARYVAQMSPHGADVDYLFLSHFHGDHSAGFARAADALRFRRAVDRGWPDYDDPLPYPKDENWMGGSLTDMRRLYGRLAKRDGLTVEKFRVGARDQLRMLHEPDAFPGFSVFNLCGNGKVALKDGTLFDCYAELAKTRKECTFNENGMSCGNVFTYGKFRYYSAGDFSDDKMHTVFRGEKMRIEKALSFAVDPVSVAKADHHACWGNPKELIAALRPKVWTIPVWWQLHCTKHVMNDFASQDVYPGDRAILPGVMCSERRTEDADAPYLKSVPEAVHAPSHVVIDVPPGGETFTVTCLDPADESLRVKAHWSFSL